MKTSGFIFKVLFLLFLSSAPVILWGQGGLTGTWKYASQFGEMTMQINATTIVINGQPYPYKTQGNVLMLTEGMKTTPHPYMLDGNQLTLEFPGGMELVFTRVSTGGDTQGQPQQGQGALPQSMARPSGGAGLGPASSSLLGRWLFQSNQGQLVLEFLSADQLNFNGEATRYQLKEGVIQAMGEYGWIDYPYSLNQGTLTITFPDGTKIPFTRSSATAGNMQSMGGQNAGGGQSWQLRGALCSWSGSSSSSSSYSRTQKIVFDGQGNFQFGSEASFSSNAGIAYSGNPNVKTGTYRVGENTVILSFSDGDTYTIQINMRQDNGMITELMYSGTLYAKGLCE